MVYMYHQMLYLKLSLLILLHKNMKVLILLEDYLKCNMILKIILKIYQEEFNYLGIGEVKKKKHNILQKEIKC